MIADGDTVSVASQIVQSLLGAGRRWFGMDDPGLVLHLGDQCVPLRPVGQHRGRAREAQLAPAAQGLQSPDGAVAEGLRQRLLAEEPAGNCY